MLRVDDAATIKERPVMTNSDNAHVPEQPPAPGPEIRPMEPNERIVRAKGVDLCTQTFGDSAECLGAEVDPLSPDDPLVGLHRPNLGTRRGRLLWDMGVVAVRHDETLLNGCSIVYSEHTAIVLRSTIDPSFRERRW